MKKNILGPVIKQARKNKKLTQKDLSNLTGFSQNTISNHENGNRSLDDGDVKKYANALGMTSDQIFEAFDIKNSIDNKVMIVDKKQTLIDNTVDIMESLDTNRQEKVYSFAERQLKEQEAKVVPLVGKTAANPTELSYGDSVHDETIDTSVPQNADCALVVQGDSMEPMFRNGTIVFYKIQPDIENGEIAIVEVNGTGVTLKKVYFNYDDNLVILKSLNDKYEDRELSPENVRIIGKVIK